MELVTQCIEVTLPIINFIFTVSEGYVLHPSPAVTAGFTLKHTLHEALRYYLAIFGLVLSYRSLAIFYGYFYH